MDGKSLQSWQAERIKDAMFSGFNYLSRLKTRMAKIGFSENDKVMMLVTKAFEATQDLYVEMSYQSCKSGAGRAPKGE